jgi:hypothetical protein
MIACPPASAQPDAAAGSLIVFRQHDPSPLGEAFAQQTLPQIEALAKELGVGLIDRRISRQGSAPEGVEITPLIVFQNHRGRSIYQGRYTTLDRVRNFVRTSRFVPQGDEPLVREDLPVWSVDGEGGPLIGTPIKITAYATAGGGYLRTSGDLDRRIRQAMDAAEPRFTYREQVELGRSDRLFYVDFYPFVDAKNQVGPDDTLYLSVAVFSQFHCHEPIWTLPGLDLSGPWADAPAVFAEGFRRAADEIARQLDESELGDGFNPVPRTVERVSWERAGLALPPAPEGASAEQLAGVELGRDWRVDEAMQADRPAVQFTFPAPLDMYAGEAGDVSGHLTLGDGLSIQGMRGRFLADPGSVTMGEPDLDAAIHATMLEVAAYPESYFVIERIESEFAEPAFGQVAAAVMHGGFTMKGQTIPLTVPISLEAYLGRDGRPRLSIDGRWELRLLEPFGIDGPPGEAPANDTLIFTCHLVLEPAG